MVRNDSDEPVASVFRAVELKSVNSSKLRESRGSSKTLETTRNTGPKGATTETTNFKPQTPEAIMPLRLLVTLKNTTGLCGGGVNTVSLWSVRVPVFRSMDSKTMVQLVEALRKVAGSFPDKVNGVCH